MKILFFYCSTPRKYFGPHYSQAIGYLSAVLKKNNHIVSCLLLTRFDKKEIIRKIEGFRPDLVAVTLFTDQFRLAELAAGFVFDKYKIPIVAGGPHATVAPEDSMTIKGLLGLCRGEGEFAFLELVETINEKRDYTNIKNFWFKDGDCIIKNDPRPRIKNLDILPFPDRQIQEEFINYKYAEFMFSRGCPFNCSYCINQFLHKFYSGDTEPVAHRTIDNIFDEISEVAKRYNPDMLMFHDDVFTSDIGFLKNFSEMYHKYFNFPILANAHPQTITKEVAELLKKANVRMIKLGVETGNYVLRKKILMRSIRDETIINAADLLRAQGIKIGTFNMIGIPGETSKNIEETIALNKKIKPSSIGLSVFKPYPGTPLYDYCGKERLISKRITDSYFDERSPLDQKCLNQNEISYYWRVFGPSIRAAKTLPLVKFAARHLIVARCYEIAKGAIKKIMPSRIKIYISKILKWK